MDDWKKFTDANGNFQLANYIYKNLNDLMKHSLDMGTLLSNDSHKLRAYKEQTKKLFKSRWYEIAQCLEAAAEMIAGTARSMGLRVNRDK